MKSTTEVFEDHLKKRLEGDLEGDIKENYADDVIMLTGTGAFRGHSGVRKSAKELKSYAKDANFTYRHTLVEDNYAFLEWTAEGDDRTIKDGADSFAIQGGKIIFQSIHYSITKK